MNHPIVSVIVATRNRSTYLRDLLNSFCRSTYSSLEVIVIDDAGESQDANARVVAALQDKLDVHLNVNTQLQGTVRSLNRGAALALGSILVFTDDDCIADAEWLARLVADYTSPHIGGVGGRVIPIENDQVRPLAARGDLRIGCVDATGGITGNFDLESDAAIQVDHLSGANMSFRRELFERLGGFDENYAGNCYRFETEWGVRVRHAGFVLLFDPCAVVAHRRAIVGGNRLQAEEWFYWYARNHIYFLAMYFPHLRAARWRFAWRLLARLARQESFPAHIGAYARRRALVCACSGVVAGLVLGWRVRSRSE